ncbi:hypothetical protein F5B17DRAFT_418729 [Nemania serpens]|nr:hypothetical protein F5B17DRAFT_418729 [Nemania serpens]
MQRTAGSIPKESQDELMRASQLMADFRLQINEWPHGGFKVRAAKMLSSLGFGDNIIDKPVGNVGELSGG